MHAPRTWPNRFNAPPAGALKIVAVDIRQDLGLSERRPDKQSV